MVKKNGSRPHHVGRNSVSAGASGITVGNRFSILADSGKPDKPDAEGKAHSTCPREVYLIGDSIVRGVRVGRPGKATTLCYPGTRVEHLTTRVQNVLSKASAAPIVVVHAGTNNIPMDSPKGIAERMRHFIREVRLVRPRAGVIVSNILPRFDGEFRNPKVRLNMVRQISQELSLLCRREGVSFFNAGPCLNDDMGKYYLRDGLHLNLEGKQLLGSELGRCARILVQGN